MIQWIFASLPALD
jgi:hypothetical protein